jgi:hypothetical protein
MKKIITAIVLSLPVGVASAEAGNGKRNRVVAGKAVKNRNCLEQNSKVARKSWHRRTPAASPAEGLFFAKGCPAKSV